MAQVKATSDPDSKQFSKQNMSIIVSVYLCLKDIKAFLKRKYYQSEDNPLEMLKRFKEIQLTRIFFA